MTGPGSPHPRRARTPPWRPGRPRTNPSGRPPPSERLRSPQPLLKRRLPSGRGATEQPNITSDGDAVLTPVFWLMVVLTGVATGLFGDLMMLVLFHIQFLAFGYHSGTLQHGVEQAPAGRRVSSLLIAGAFGGEIGRAHV